MIEKIFYAHIYNSEGDYVDLLYDIPEPSFTESLNGGNGSLSLTLPFRFDNYGKGITLDVGFRIELFVAYSLFPTGKRIYNGRIDALQALAGRGENVRVKCSGYIHQLALDLYERSNNTVYHKYESTEIGEIIKDIIDQYQDRRTDNVITYTASSIGDTSKNETIEFYLTTPFDAINAVMQMADPDWFYYIDADNVFNFFQISTTPDHIFTLGANATDIVTDLDIAGARTDLVFSNGISVNDPGYFLKRYTSVSTYVQRQFDFKRDNRYSEPGADDFANRFTDIYKNGFNQTRIRVKGDGIENIKPGDTFALNNYTGDTDISDNNLIVTIDRTIDYIDITAEDSQAFVSRLLQERRDKQDLIDFNDNLPKTYTT